MRYPILWWRTASDGSDAADWRWPDERLGRLRELSLRPIVGLVHHGNYDVGSAITTPIMGSNTQGDRSIWSSYTADNVAHDNLAELTQVLGARADEAKASPK